MGQEHQAVWLNDKAKPLKVASTEEYTPGSDEVLIHNAAVAINPVDWKMQDTGIFIEKYPRILGTDVAGEVIKTGSNVTQFKSGDRVIGHCMSLVTAQAKHSGFQNYTVVPANRVAKLPDKYSFAEGAVLPLAISTAADGLCGSRADGKLGVDYPTVKGLPQTKVLVVYGASSSVGIVTIQLAAKSGVKVIGVASEKNFDFCKGAGASDLFDYKDSHVVDKVVEAVKKSGLEFAGVYDAISLADQSYKITIPILEKLGGGNLATVLPPPESLPSDIKAGGVFAGLPSVEPVWRDFVQQALASGDLKPLPAPKVVGKGLEYVQQGLDLNKKGVSASKIVIEL